MPKFGTFEEHLKFSFQVEKQDQFQDNGRWLKYNPSAFNILGTN